MKKLLIVIALFVSACTSNAPKTEVVVEYQYVKTKVPTAFLDIPPYPPALTPTSMTQKDVAEWLLLNEQRTRLLEDNILKIREFNSRP